MGAEAWRCVFVWAHMMQNAYACTQTKGTEGCLKNMHQAQQQWAELVCSSLTFLFSLSARKVPSSSQWALSAGAKINIASFFVMSVLSFESHHLGWSRNMKDETQPGMLRRCYHTHLFTVHFLLSNGLSHTVTPHYTHLIQCVTVWA